MKSILLCTVCEREFEHKSKFAKTCSFDCMKKRKRIVDGNSKGMLYETNISHGTIGAISELVISADLMKKGYAVFRALSPSCFCDVIAIKDTRILKMEIRTGYKNEGTGNICFSTKLRGSADCFAVFDRKMNTIYYLDISKKFINV